MELVTPNGKLAEFYAMDILRMRHDNDNRMSESSEMINNFIESNPDVEIDWSFFTRRIHVDEVSSSPDSVLKEAESAGIPSNIIQQLDDSYREMTDLLSESIMEEYSYSLRPFVSKSIAIHLVLGGVERFNPFIFTSLFHQKWTSRTAGIPHLMEYVNGAVNFTEKLRTLRDSEDSKMLEKMNWGMILHQFRSSSMTQSYGSRQRAIARKYPDLELVAPLIATQLSSADKIHSDYLKEDLVDIVNLFGYDVYLKRVLSSHFDMDRIRVIADRYNGDIDILFSVIDTETLKSAAPDWVRSWIG